MSFYAGPERGALALVESPAQLLNVIELARREDDLAGVKIAVLAPSASLTRNQLRSMVTLGREAGHSISWHEPRLGGMAVARNRAVAVGRRLGEREFGRRFQIFVRFCESRGGRFLRSRGTRFRFLRGQSAGLLYANTTSPWASPTPPSRCRTA